MVEIEIARRIAAKINAGQHRQPWAHALNVSRLAAENIALLALLNQTIAEVRAQRKSVVAKESGEGKLPLLVELPVVGGDEQGVVSVSSWRLSMVSPATGTAIGISPGT